MSLNKADSLVDMIVPAIRYHNKKSVDVSVTYDNRDSLDERNVCVLINEIHG